MSVLVSISFMTAYPYRTPKAFQPYVKAIARKANALIGMLVTQHHYCTFCYMSACVSGSTHYTVADTLHKACIPVSDGCMGMSLQQHSLQSRTVRQSLLVYDNVFS